MNTIDSIGFTIGGDITAISRIKNLLDDHPDRFKKFAFTSRERTYCDKQINPAQHYAARWAVKEAYVKAVGEIGANPNLSTIEIVRKPTPHVSLSDEGLELLHHAAESRGVPIEHTEVAITLSHEKKLDLALGIVLIKF
jgi:holo-[acyl-carrier protein] synthase